MLNKATVLELIFKLDRHLDGVNGTFHLDGPREGKYRFSVTLWDPTCNQMAEVEMVLGVFDVVPEVRYHDKGSDHTYPLGEGQSLEILTLSIG